MKPYIALPEDWLSKDKVDSKISGNVNFIVQIEVHIQTIKQKVDGLWLRLIIILTSLLLHLE